jgi:uncharacterized DUF497 family protein
MWVVRIHEEFEWDEDKAEANFRKHGITFEAASEVLSDPDGDRFHLDEDDVEHADGEDRYITTGSDPTDRRLVLVICWTDRSTDDEQVTRIISARVANKKEVRNYVKGLGG